ncbi:MAG: small basic protein [Pirellula sp.]|jgi:small basic protein (TIGR04137 family)|nr:small basic protein [Pirellula sp.]
MTIDKSLKVRRGATSTRSVLTRAERLERLKENDRWSEGMSPIGLPKVRVKKLSLKKKKKTKKEEDEAAPAKGGKAAPAKGGKK